MKIHPTVLLALLISLAGVTIAQSTKGKPFNGKNLNGWNARQDGKRKSHWRVGSASLHEEDPRMFEVDREGNQLINDVSSMGQGLDLYSEQEYGDCILKLQVMVPKGSNSGIYLMGEYEIQILDSYGKDKNPGKGDMGAIYGASAPTHPVYRKYGAWSSFEIHFRAPRFDQNGKKVQNARFEKVVLNDRVIHRDVEVKSPTHGGLTGRERPTGPILFQGNHGAVAFREISVEPLRD